MSAIETFPGSVYEAETLWYDTERWARWVDGLDRVERVEGQWPGVGGSVSWQSGPAGRGRVTERVVRYEPRGGQTVDVEDDSIRGRQSVAFTPVDGAVSVELTIEYEVKRRSPFTPLVDLLFIRPAFRSSIQTTLHRFGVELATRVRGGAGDA